MTQLLIVLLMVLLVLWVVSWILAHAAMAILAMLAIGAYGWWHSTRPRA